MKVIHVVFTALHTLMALLFALVSVVLLWIAISKGWATVNGGLSDTATLHMVEVLGILACAVVALQISQTVVEEEVVRDASIAGPTRVRRFLSRFLVVVVVALTIEGLIATFKAQEQALQLLYVAAHIAAVGMLLLGWGVFVHLNRSAEELEPDALQEATQEDDEVSGHEDEPAEAVAAQDAAPAGALRPQR